MFNNVDADTLSRAKKIRLLILDVDGVLSDGRLYFSNSGEEIKSFNSLDGHGIKMAQQQGIKVAIITGRTSDIVQKRANDLGITDLIQGREDKLQAMQELLQPYDFALEEVAHMGDDMPDLPIIKRVGLGMAPANAHFVIKQHCQWQSEKQGGEGAVRDACDMLLHAQDKLNDTITPYL